MSPVTRLLLGKCGWTQPRSIRDYVDQDEIVIFDADARQVGLTFFKPAEDEDYHGDSESETSCDKSETARSRNRGQGRGRSRRWLGRRRPSDPSDPRFHSIEISRERQLDADGNDSAYDVDDFYAEYDPIDGLDYEVETDVFSQLCRMRRALNRNKKPTERRRGVREIVSRAVTDDHETILMPRVTRTPPGTEQLIRQPRSERLAAPLTAGAVVFSRFRDSQRCSGARESRRRTTTRENARPSQLTLIGLPEGDALAEGDELIDSSDPIAG